MSQAAQRWSAVLARAQHSELSLREFARREGYNPNTLAWWRWNLRRQKRESDPAPRLAEVVLVEDEEPPPTNDNDGLRVRVGQAEILVHSNDDLELLRRVVEVLA